MAFTILSKLTITGNGAEMLEAEVQKLFLFDTELGDFCKSERGKVTIQAESRWLPPLAAIQQLSHAHPSLSFDISGDDITNGLFHRWTFEAGKSRLLDCEEYGPVEDRDDDPIVYVQNGALIREPLPNWVPVADAPSSDAPSSADDSEIDQDFLAEILEQNKTESNDC